MWANKRIFISKFEYSTPKICEGENIVKQQIDENNNEQILGKKEEAVAPINCYFGDDFGHIYFGGRHILHIASFLLLLPN